MQDDDKSHYWSQINNQTAFMSEFVLNKLLYPIGFFSSFSLFLLSYLLVFYI